MLWLKRKKFVSSYLLLSEISRAYLASPYENCSCEDGSSDRKLTYTPWAYGRIASQAVRAHALWRSGSGSSGSHEATKLMSCAELRPEKAVASSATRATAPPRVKIGMAESGELM